MAIRSATWMDLYAIDRTSYENSDIRAKLLIYELFVLSCSTTFALILWWLRHISQQAIVRQDFICIDVVPAI